MKSLHVTVLAAVVSIACSAMTAILLRDASRESGTAAHAAPASVELESALEALRREQAALKRELGEIRTAAERAPTDPGTRTAAAELTAEEVERIVARALDAREMSSEPREATPEEVAAAVGRLLDPGWTEEERIAIWDELFAKGMLDAVVAEYERRAQAAPNDTTASTELGFAYHQKMRHSANGPEKGKWGQRGSEAYARTLELDDSNWDARFAQAQHFWYADMPGDALRHLQILREQQTTRRSEGKHAQAFVLLGNLYMQQGNAAEAKKVWAEGLERFPGDVRLGELSGSGQ